MNSLRYYSIAILLLVFGLTSVFSQQKSALTKAQQMLQGYKPPVLTAAPPTQTPEQSWHQTYLNLLESQKPRVIPQSSDQGTGHKSITEIRADMEKYIAQQKLDKKGAFDPTKKIVAGTNGATFSGKVYADLNSDYSYSAGDTGLAGVKIWLYSYYQGISISTISDANGDYTFSPSVPGWGYDYAYMSLDNSVAYDRLENANGAGYFYYYDGFSTTVNIGLDPRAAWLSGFAYSDLNGNATQDGGESPKNGVSISAYNTSNGATYSATTDANGHWTIQLPVSSSLNQTFTVSALVGSGFKVTQPTASTYSVLISAADTIYVSNFGIWAEPLQVNTMPSYATSGTYANALVNTPITVWGNIYAGNAPYQYFLDYGDGTIDSGAVSDPHFVGSDHTYTSSGPKTVTLLVIDNSGARDSSTSTIRVYAASTQQIRVNIAIEKGLLYNYLHQYADGSWSDASSTIAATGAALLTFEENGHKPSNNFKGDIYARYVRLGLNWLLGHAQRFSVYSQPAGDPDGNHNGYGAYLDAGTYANGLGELAIIGSHATAAGAQTDTIRSGAYAGQTYYDFAQDAIDQWAFSQTDNGFGEGGWHYSVNTPSTGDQDNSTTQWAVLNLSAGEHAWGLSVPSWTKTELLKNLINTQGSTGGFAYMSPGQWENVTKTAAGIADYAFIGYTTDSAAVANALTFINNNWGETIDNNGWAGHLNGNMYGMYGIAKGMRTINHGAGQQLIGSHDWYAEYVTHLLDDNGFKQNSDGSFPRSGTYPTGAMGDPLNSSMAILILTQGVVTAPPVAVIEPISNQPPNHAFQVSGINSYHLDPAKSITQYQWDWNAANGLDWNSADAFGPIAMNPGYADTGTYTVSLRVKDNSDPPQYSVTTRTVHIQTTNNPPIAVAIPPGYGPAYAAHVGEPILLDGRASHDPDAPLDSVVAYNWDTNGDGIFGDSHDATVTVTFNTETQGQVGLRVYDTHGDSSQNNAYINIIASRKDLSVTGFAITPSTVDTGAVLHIVAAFANDANSTQGFSNVQVRFFDGDPLTTGNPFGGTYSVNLPVGGRDTIRTTITVPSTFALGSHSMHVWLDANQVIPEWNELNNLATSPITVAHFVPGTISGMKFNDLNGNGIKDSGEPGLPNWTVFIDANVNGSIDVNEISAVTDNSGSYSFGGLPPGAYTVREVQQTGWVQTSTNPAEIQIQNGSTIAGTDFGNFQMGSISGLKYNDLNGNGSRDEAEPVLSGWTIYIDANSNGSKDQNELSAVTDANGSYTFSDLGPGTYRLREVGQDGWAQSSTNPSDIALTSGATVTGVNFGNHVSTGTISGIKFEDHNGNGILDQGDQGLAGWMIYIDANGNDSLDKNETRVLTGNDGSYSFTLTAGIYRIREVQQSGWARITAQPKDDTLSGGGAIANVNFGNFRYGSISGMKYKDLNSNGVKDQGEPGLSGWMIYLDANNSGAFDTGESFTMTDANGNYTFSNLLGGTYHVLEIQQSGWSRTSALPAPVTMLSGLNQTGVDFGNINQTSISGTKYNDLNGNGTKDAGEPGLAGWTIFIDANTNGSLDGGEISTTTDVNGAYVLIVPNGTYTVREVQQSGWIQTTSNPGLITISNGNSVSAVNFGNYQLGTISGTTYEDVNGNSTHDAGDLNLQGWTVFLDVNNNGSLDGGEVSTTTDVSGHYSFTGLHAGTYKVREVLQSGWQASSTLPTDINMISGGNFSTVDFGNFHLATIAGVTFVDRNQNGTKDAGDAGLANWKIFVDLNNNDTADVAEPSTLTDGSGAFSFTGLSAGTYLVREVLQTGWTRTTTNPSAITIASGGGVTNVSFGNYKFGSISGTKYYDHDSSGTIGLIDGPRRNFQIVLTGTHHAADTSVTDSNGTWGFHNLPADTYTIREVAKTGWVQTRPAQNGVYTITMLSGLDTTGLIFANFYKPDTARYLTFTLPLAGATRVGYNRISKPKTANVVDSAFLKGAYPTDGFLIGVDDHAGNKTGGAIRFWRQVDIRWLASKSRRPRVPFTSGPLNFTGIPTSLGLVKTTMINAIVVEAVPLKLAVGASNVGLSTVGLGDLVFDNGLGAGNPFNGKTIRQIVALADTALTYGSDPKRHYTQAYFDSLTATMNRINNSFLPTTLSNGIIVPSCIVSQKPMVITSLTSLKSVRCLYRDPNVVPFRQVYALLDQGVDAEGTVPEQFSLSQNYPNPFNPSTKIQFELPTAAEVTLKVYNMLGQEVATLLEGVQYDEGISFVDFTADKFATGVYIYRMSAKTVDEDGVVKTFTAVNKMLLIK